MTTKKTKYYTDTAGLASSNMGTAVHAWAKNQYTPPEMKLEGTEAIDDIEYWGHYPIVDMEYKADMPVSVGMRAFTPFIPGDEDVSMLPAAMFEIYLRNTGNEEQQGTVAFSFAGPEKYEFRPDESGIKSVTVNGSGLWGIGYESKYTSYILTCTEECRTGGGLYNDGPAWAAIDNSLPENSETNYGASCAVDYKLLPGENRSIRFILSWYSPYWLGRGKGINRIPDHR
ncbi:MAG: GH116 family glycosyl-hydrolase [Bacillota bacterium]